MNYLSFLKKIILLSLLLLILVATIIYQRRTELVLQGKIHDENKIGIENAKITLRGREGPEIRETLKPLKDFQGPVLSEPNGFYKIKGIGTKFSLEVVANGFIPKYFSFSRNEEIPSDILLIPMPQLPLKDDLDLADNLPGFFSVPKNQVTPYHFQRGILDSSQKDLADLVFYSKSMELIIEIPGGGLEKANDALISEPGLWPGAILAYLYEAPNDGYSKLETFQYPELEGLREYWFFIKAKNYYAKVYFGLYDKKYSKRQILDGQLDIIFYLSRDRFFQGINVPLLD